MACGGYRSREIEVKYFKGFIIIFSVVIELNNYKYQYNNEVKIIILIITGGLADRTGAIHVGDRLLAINGADLSEAPLSTAIAQLQNTDDRVVITVCRPQQTAAATVRRPFYTSVGLLSADDSAIESDTTCTRSAPNLHEPTPERIVLRHRSKSAQRKVPEFDSDYFGGTLRPYYIREHADYDVDSIFKIAENQDRDAGGLLDFDLFQVRQSANSKYPPYNILMKTIVNYARDGNAKCWWGWGLCQD